MRDILDPTPNTPHPSGLYWLLYRIVCWIFGLGFFFFFLDMIGGYIQGINSTCCFMITIRDWLRPPSEHLSVLPIQAVRPFILKTGGRPERWYQKYPFVGAGPHPRSPGECQSPQLVSSGSHHRFIRDPHLWVTSISHGNCPLAHPTPPKARANLLSLPSGCPEPINDDKGNVETVSNQSSMCVLAQGG